LPPGRNILLSQNYSLNIARKGNYQIKVFIGDINLRPIIYFSHKFGENNYDLYSNDMKKLTSNENYYLVIVEYETNSLLYKQDIIFSDFQFLNSYYLSLREIKILNTIDKISDLIIMNSKNNKESYYISKKDQFLFKDNKYISIIIPQEIEDEKKYGYYDVKYNNLNIAKIFISKDLINADFYYIQITGKSNLIIKSYDYYLPYITEIIINKNNKDYNFTKENITFEEDYIKINIPELDNNDLILKYIGESCTYSPSEICRRSFNQKIIYENEPKLFQLKKKYQILSKESNLEAIELDFNISNPSESLKKDILNKIFINNKLTNKCYFEGNIVKCDISSPDNYEIINFTYNEFENTLQKYSFLLFDFDGENCITKIMIIK
jgi:hypothetical protein